MDKRPFVTKEKVEKITKIYPTPFHLYDEKGIRENVKALKEAFSWNKGYKEYFAVKATPNPFLIDILKEYGCGCDCSSYTELMMSEALEITGEDIMFSSNDTPAEEFIYADKLGAIINLDDITHIDFLEQAIGHVPETISCRFNPGGLFKISNDIMDNPGDAKYGMTPEQILEAYKILKSKGAKEFGLHAFLASNTVTNDYYPMLAKVLFEQAVKLSKEAGVHIKFINLSGGIGIPYKPDQEPNDIYAIGEGVRKVYEEVLVPAGMGDVAIYTELGRYMMGPYGCLVTKAIHEKNTYKNYIGVDACAVNLMRPAMYGAYHHITVLGKEDEPCDHKYDVTGSLCENNDKFAVDRMLPLIERGDYLVIHDTGAHGFAMGYNYNGKLKSAELLLKENGEVKLIRRAETPADYFSTFDCFEIGKKYAIIGESGVGKSSMIKAMIGINDNYTGEILFDGISKEAYNKDSIFQQIAYISQDAYIFNDTIRFNLTLGDSGYTDVQLKDVLNMVNLGEFLTEKGGLDAMLGDNGKNISGGQKQRLAIARSLLQKKRIFVVDEGTSALDIKNVAIIERLLLETEEYTTILITHNMKENTQKYYDQVIHLKGGE